MKVANIVSDNDFRLISDFKYFLNFDLLRLFQQLHCHVTSTRSHLQNHICGPQCSLKQTQSKGLCVMWYQFKKCF